MILRPGTFFCSCRRNHHNSRNRGIRDSAKKGAALMVYSAVNHLGADVYAQQPDDQDPEPVAKIPSGITKATSTVLRQQVLRKIWDAIRLVMNNTKLDWIPLHSWATCSTIPGVRTPCLAGLRGARRVENTWRRPQRMRC